MRQKPGTIQVSPERVAKDIRRATRKHYSAEVKIRVVPDGLRGEHSIAELCRREGIAGSLCFSWPREFLEAVVAADVRILAQRSRQASKEIKTPIGASRRRS
ncbi:MAG: transposase [Dongiaceae bacterium]